MSRTKRAAPAAFSAHEESPTKRQRTDGTDAFVTTVDLSAADPAVRERVRSRASYRLMPDSTAPGGQTPTFKLPVSACALPCWGLKGLIHHQHASNGQLQEDLPQTLVLAASTW